MFGRICRKGDIELLKHVIPVLFKDKSECCGCGACMNQCPQSAISMKKDEYGFLYPSIDESRCIRCNSCLKSCNYQNSIIDNKPLYVYAAATIPELF